MILLTMIKRKLSPLKSRPAKKEREVQQQSEQAPLQSIYTARIVDKNGTIIDEVLVDKQSGTIQSLEGQIGSGGLKG